MDKPLNIAVLGGGGKTGVNLVNGLLRDGYHPRVLIRRPVASTLLANEQILHGDALSVDRLRGLLSGAEALISVIGQRPGEPLVASQLMTYLLDLLPSFGIRRFVMLAGVNVDAPGDQKGSAAVAATEWMRSTFPEIHADRQDACDKLYESQLAWTLVRVPLIDFTSERGKQLVGLRDCPGNSVDVHCLVDFLIKQLTDDKYIGKCPFVASESYGPL
jgi:putative NADH-flavin reductase